MTEDSASKFCNFIDAHPRFFKSPKEWFLENWHVVEAFERQALRLIGMNREHYSARTIVEVLRHHSVLNDTSDAFKINDHNAPDLARAFVVLHPEHVDFWEYRRPDSIAFKGMFTQKENTRREVP